MGDEAKTVWTWRASSEPSRYVSVDLGACTSWSYVCDVDGNETDLELAEPTHIRDATLKIEDDGVTYAFKPQRDITAYELALLWSRDSIGAFDDETIGLADWLTETGLIRHFEVR